MFETRRFVLSEKGPPIYSGPRRCTRDSVDVLWSRLPAQFGPQNLLNATGGRRTLGANPWCEPSGWMPGGRERYRRPHASVGACRASERRRVGGKRNVSMARADLGRLLGARGPCRIIPAQAASLPRLRCSHVHCIAHFIARCSRPAGCV